MDARMFTYAYTAAEKVPEQNHLSRPVALELARRERYGDGIMAGTAFQACDQHGITAGEIHEEQLHADHS
jgi:hypothetical protein